MTNTQAAVQLLMSSISVQKTTPTGDTETTYDPEQIKYQLYNVDSDNFTAFLKSYKDAQYIAEFIRDTVLPGVGLELGKMIHALAENTMISIGGKSSEKGRLLNMLLRDTQEQKIMYSGIPAEKKSFLGGLGQTNQEQGHGGQQQGGQNPPPRF